MFENEVEHFMMQDETSPVRVIDFTIRIPNNRYEEFKKLLKDNSFDLLQENTRAYIPVKENIGKQITTMCPVVVAQDITIKTPLSTYKIAKVVLPKGTLGTITGIDKNAYAISFDTDLKVNPYDVEEGNLTDIPAYPFASYNLTPEKIEII